MTFYSFPDSALPHSKNRHLPYHPRLRWALAWTLCFATLYSLWAAAISLVQHRTYFPEYHLSIWSIIAVYYVASLVCGIALGFFYPLANRRWGAALLGLVLGFTAYATVSVAMFGLHRLPILLALIPGIIIGGGLGLVIYDDDHKIGLPPQRSVTADQKPLLIIGILGFLAFFAAVKYGFSEQGLYWVAAVCLGATIGVWIFLQRTQGGTTRSSSHAT
jgi:hypothetical protein